MDTMIRAVFDSSTLQQATAGEAVQLPDATSSDGCASVSGNTLVLKGKGTYLVCVNATLQASAAGALRLQATRNGMAVPGAQGIGTAAAGDLVPMSFSMLVTVGCDAERIQLVPAQACSVRVAQLIAVKA